MTVKEDSFTFLKNIINNIPLCIFLKDTDGNIILANKYHYDFYENFYNGNGEIEFHNDFKISQKEDFEVLKSKTALSFLRKFHLKNGDFVWKKIIKIPVFSDGENIKNILAILIDNSSERFLKEQKDTSAATLTHDLKTPISAQIGAINILLKKTLGNLNETQENILNQIKDSCSYTRSLAGNILDNYLHEYGQMKIYPEIFDWNIFIDEIIKEMSCLANIKSQSITNFSDFSEKKIFADKFQLKRAVINLISNAIKYGNSNSEIEIFSRIDNNNLIFSIKNYSQYITKECIEKIYEKFQTFNQGKGTGLGLYLVKQVVEKHSGYVFAKSKPDGECTFGFALPKEVIYSQG